MDRIFSSGILILSVGEDRRQLLWDCLDSLYRNNPDIPVHVVCDTALSVPHTIVNRKFRGFRSRHYKTQMHRISPFNGVTLFLDDDTIVHKPLPPLRDLLGSGDVALAREPAYMTVQDICSRVGSGRTKYRKEQEHTRNICLPDQPHYNSGVFAFNRSYSATSMFNRWHQTWKMFRSLDQLALCRAMSYYPMIVTELDGAEYNCHNDYFPYRELNPTIFHFSRDKARRWYYRNHHGPGRSWEKVS